MTNMALRAQCFRSKACNRNNAARARALRTCASLRQKDGQHAVHDVLRPAILSALSFAAALQLQCCCVIAADDAMTSAVTSSSPAAAEVRNAITPVYFGNGCFWGRQKDFVDTEMSMGRQRDGVTAVVGYAGGTRAGPDGRVCYYYSEPQSVYERLGHAEVVKLDVDSSDLDAAKQQMRAFAKTYFKQFQRTPFGMMRLDPQDRGPGYRNVIGIPGGIDSPLFEAIAAENVNGMKLVRGNGNEGSDGREQDKLNTVYILDSNSLPFYQAELYHQFHNGIGAAFPQEYTRGMKSLAMANSKISKTGCPEY